MEFGSVQHSNISTAAAGWIATIFGFTVHGPQRTNTHDSNDSRTFFPLTPLTSAVGLIMKFCTNIHVPPEDELHFAAPLTPHLSITGPTIFSLTNTSVLP